MLYFLSNSLQLGFLFYLGLFNTFPPEFGGTGKDPIWGLHPIHLGSFDLKYVPDPKNPSHGFIAPAKDMEYTHYEQCIYDTRDIWCPITKEDLDDENS